MTTTATPYERRLMACEAAIEAWLSAASPSRAIIDAFDDDDLKPTEAEISLGLEAVRIFRVGHNGVKETARRVAE